MTLFSTGRRGPGPERIATLRSIPLFRGCSDRELADIDGLVTDARFGLGEYLVREGAVARQAFVIVDGAAEVLVGDTVVNTLGPGDLIGEMALVDGRPRSASVRAVGEVAVLALDQRSLTSLFDHPSVARHAMRNLSLDLRHAQEAQKPASVSSISASQVLKRTDPTKTRQGETTWR